MLGERIERKGDRVIDVVGEELNMGNGGRGMGSGDGDLSVHDEYVLPEVRFGSPR